MGAVLGLFSVVPETGQHGLSPLYLPCPEGLAQSVLVVGYKFRCNGEDISRRPIVLLQPNDLGTGKEPGEIDDVFYLRASETVYGLIIVPHHTEVGGIIRQLAEKLELGNIGVLVFIY